LISSVINPYSIGLTFAVTLPASTCSTGVAKSVCATADAAIRRDAATVPRAGSFFILGKVS
jgi:hypothetical protein